MGSVSPHFRPFGGCDAPGAAAETEEAAGRTVHAPRRHRHRTRAVDKGGVVSVVARGGDAGAEEEHAARRLRDGAALAAAHEPSDLGASDDPSLVGCRARRVEPRRGRGDAEAPQVSGGAAERAGEDGPDEDARKEAVELTLAHDAPEAMTILVFNATARGTQLPPKDNATEEIEPLVVIRRAAAYVPVLP